MENRPETGVVSVADAERPRNTFYRVERPDDWPYRTYEAVVGTRWWDGPPVRAVCSVTKLPDGPWEIAFSWNAKPEAEGGFFNRWRYHNSAQEAVKALGSHYGVMLDNAVMRADEGNDRRHFP